MYFTELKDLMEEGQLNFNQPLLSVRRGTSATAPAEIERKAHNPHPSMPRLPYYKTELKSGPVRNPGVVPFKWECKPGTPKEEDKAQTNILKDPPRAPKLPPGRTVNHMQKQPDEILRVTSTSSSRDRATISTSSLESSPDKFLVEVEEPEKEIELKEISSSEDENVTYLDAQQSFSRTESFFKRIVSGVSGPDVPESSRDFSDPQTRNFMMDRFIPAAKAVASEAPPYASRRHHVAKEQEKPITQVVRLKKQSPQANANPDIWPNKINAKDTEEEEEEEEDDEFEGTEDLPVKFCGLMPRFCMLNPVPGMKDHVQVVSSVRSVRTKPASAQTCRDNMFRDGVANSRGDLKSAHQYTPGPVNESLMNSYLGHYGMANHSTTSLQMCFDKEKQLLGLPGESRVSTNLPKTGCSKLELPTQKDGEEITGLVKPTEEKTLYVDSERTVESRFSSSSSSESRGTNPTVDHSLHDCGDENAFSSEMTYPSAFSTPDNFVHDVKEGSKRLQKHDEDIDKIVKIAKPLKLGVRRIEPSENRNSALVLTPFLPKSPSESWLSRTLPSLSSRKTSSKSHLTNYAYRPSLADHKQRLLTTSNLQNMPFLSARELAPIPEN